MSAFTDRLYHQWRNQQRNFGLLLTTGRPSTPSKTKFQKAENRSAPTPRRGMECRLAINFPPHDPRIT